MELRQYQIDARDAVWASFREGARSGVLILPTGAGKTVTCGAIIAPFKGKKSVLFVVHREELLEQARATFERMGMSCGLEKASNHVDLANLPDVTLASVQSLRGKRLERFAADTFHVVVVDEGHRGFADTYKKIYAHFASAKVLALTATPDRGDGKPLSEVYERVMFRMEIGEAVQRGILCPIELLDVAVDGLKLDDIKTTAGDYAQGELEQEILKDAVLHGMAKPLAETTEGRRIIAFLPGIASAHRFAEVAAEYGISAVAVDGTMKKEARAEALRKYTSGEVRMICCADLLSEGFDHPATDCVALCSPTKSRSRIIQRIGRGTRNSPGKANLLVVNFAPGTVKRATMQSPEDALAGCPFVVRPSYGSTFKQKLKEAFDAIVAEEACRLVTQRKLVKTVGVEYAITRLTLAEFLSAASVPTGGDGVTEVQLERLAQLKFSRDEMASVRTSKEASAVIEACQRRRDMGLCSPAQAKRLRGYGYPDTLTSHEASALIERLIANNWKPLEPKRARKAS